jgi:hypothetical protein
MAQLTAFEYGQIAAHMHHSLGAAEISRIILKNDGQSHWSEHCIWDAMEKLKANKDFRGERQEGSGRPRLTTPKQDRSIKRYVLRNRGREKVTVAILKKRFLFLRKFGNTLVEKRVVRSRPRVDEAAAQDLNRQQIHS